jgi:hypothetical protein
MKTLRFLLAFLLCAAGLHGAGTPTFDTVNGVAIGGGANTITLAKGTTTITLNATGTPVLNTLTINGHDLTANVTLTKGDLSLGNVENTALSTWAGSTNLTTLGTVTAGTWQAGIIAPAYLGTGTSIATKYLRGDGTWQTVAAGGLTVGTTTITGGTTGRLLYNNAGVLGELTLGTGVQTALGLATGSAGGMVLFNGALGTPGSGTLTNCTGLPTTSLTGTITNAQLAGSIAASKLVGTDITTVGTLSAGAVPTTLLTGTITNAQLASGVSTGGNNVGDSGKLPAFDSGGGLTATSFITVKGRSVIGPGGLILYNTANSHLATLRAPASLAVDPQITVPSVDGTLVSTGDTGSVTNAMLAGSIAASKLVGTDIATVGTLTAGATGAGFTVALSTSTITGTLADARLSANVPLLNAANTFTAAGAASTPAAKWTGAPYTAGTATTNFPLVYVSDAAATASTTLSTAGTMLGINGHSATGHLLNVMLDGAARFQVGRVNGSLDTNITSVSGYHEFRRSISGGAAQYLIGTADGTGGWEWDVYKSGTTVIFNSNIGSWQFSQALNTQAALSTNSTLTVAGASTLTGGITGDLKLDKTVTAAGTTGAQTINKSSGSVNFAAAATSLVVTNSLCTANSIITCTIATNDATAANVKVVAGAGSFTIYLGTAPTAETRVNFHLTN